MNVWAWVALGSSLGGGARYAVNDLFGRIFELPLPWSTLFVNISGSLLIGVFAALTMTSGRWHLTAGQQAFIMAGFCGGYTTFSIFSLETLMLLESEPWLAALTMGSTAVVCLAAVGCGYRLGARATRPRASASRG